MARPNLIIISCDQQRGDCIGVEGRGDEKIAAYWPRAVTPRSLTPWMADRAIERLKHGRDGNKPLCTWIRFPDPHQTFDCPEPWSRLNDPAEITLPEYRTRDFAMNEWELLPNRVGVALSLRGVRARTHKLTMDMRRGDGELYDLEDDPGEMTKVFDDPDHADIRQRLTGFLAQRSDDFAPNRKPVGPA